MIRDLSQVLRQILEDAATSAPVQLAELATALISFERPAESFNPTQTTVNLFLFDIREAVELRNQEPRLERDGDRVTVRPPPTRLGCTYLVTAWPVGDTETVLQEHRLLSQVFQVFSAYPVIPSDFLVGTRLEGQEPPLPLMLHRGEEMRIPADFWTAVGNKLRPSLTVTAVLSVPPFEPQAPPSLPVVTTKVLRLGLPGHQETSFQIRGQVLQQTDSGPTPVANATVTLVEAGLVSTTNADGRYSFSQLSAGSYTLRADVTSPEGGEIEATGAIALALPESPASESPALDRYNILVST